jgi:hypothetical protein
MVAALFALHPLQVDSVAWIAERKNVLSALFFLLTLWAYARYAEVRRLKTGDGRDGTDEIDGRSKWTEDSATQHESRSTHQALTVTSPRVWYVLAVVMFALGLMSKPTLVPLPFLLLLLDYWPLGRMQNAECRMQNDASRFTFHLSRLTCLPLLLEKLPFLVLTAVSSLVTLRGHESLGALGSWFGRWI